MNIRKCELQRVHPAASAASTDHPRPPFIETFRDAREAAPTGMLMMNSGGTMGATSTVAVGSTFWFEIPFELDAVKAGAVQQAVLAPAARCLQGVNILVTDDCDIILGVVRHILEEHGATVSCCSDGAAAVDYVRDHQDQLDIVLIDVHMPILDGNAAVRRIRGELCLKTLPIIGLTAGALVSEQRRSLDAGMNQIITKPFDPKAMVREVRMLARRRAPGMVGT